jgi:hypothetical protein
MSLKHKNAKKQTGPSTAPAQGRSARRTSPHIFDRIFRELLHLSNRAIISFINGLFQTRYPLDSAVEALSTQTVDEGLRLRTSDTMLLINGVTYHIEVQTTFRTSMTIRVFEYGLAHGVGKKTLDGGIRTIVFPQPRIIYLTTGGETPKKQTLRLQFPSGFVYDYEVETFNPLEHSVEELEERGMALLLPFYVMKMRDQVIKADAAGRRKLSAEMNTLLDKVDEAVKNCKRKGQIDEQDAYDIMQDLDCLLTELYGGYKEFAEDAVMGKKFVRPSDRVIEEARLKIAKNFLALGDSPEKVAKATELPLRKVKALLKTLNAEQPA